MQLVPTQVASDDPGMTCRHGANTDLTTKHGHRPYDRIDDVDEAVDIVRMLDGQSSPAQPAVV